MQSPRGVPRKRCSEICSKFKGEHPCRSAISIKLLCNFTEITFRHGCSLVNLLYIYRTPFLKNTSGGLLLNRHLRLLRLIEMTMTLGKNQRFFFSIYTIYTFSNKKLAVTYMSKCTWDPSQKAITK